MDRRRWRFRVSDQIPVELRVPLDPLVDVVAETLCHRRGPGVEAWRTGPVPAPQEPAETGHMLGARGEPGWVDQIDAADRPAEARAVVIDDPPVDAEQQRVQGTKVAPQQRGPAVAGPFECPEEIATHVGRTPPVGRFP